MEMFKKEEMVRLLIQGLELITDALQIFLMQCEMQKEEERLKKGENIL